MTEPLANDHLARKLWTQACDEYDDPEARRLRYDELMVETGLLTADPPITDTPANPPEPAE